jgi:glutamate carboxypeptidase
MSHGRELLAYFAGRSDYAIDLLRRLVEIDSPTSDKAGVDRTGDLVARELRAANARVSVLRLEDAGNVLRGLFAAPAGGAAGEERPPAMLLGHLDTVWPVGEASRRPFRIEGGFASGPGVFDMKAGVVLAVLLARAAHEGKFHPKLPVVCLFSGDEESGSPIARPLIEAEGKRSSYVLGLEPPQPDGGAKTSRKGVGRAVLRVDGVAAHAGIDPEKGVNAIEEIAAQILAVKAAQDPAAGTTIQAGLVQGGVARNVVAPAARVECDVRVATQAEWHRVESVLSGLQPRDPRARLRVDVSLTHPPMMRTAAVESLYRRAREAARDVGFDLREGPTGGGSDGSHCAALGIPVLDGLGVEGEAAHAVDERVRVDRIATRAAFLARLLEVASIP